MATRDIYATGFDEDVQTESSANQCPECDGQVTTNVKETVCEDCGLVIEEQRLDHGPEWRAYDADERERTGAPRRRAQYCSSTNPGGSSGIRQRNSRRPRTSLVERGSHSSMSKPWETTHVPGSSSRNSFGRSFMLTSGSR